MKLTVSEDVFKQLPMIKLSHGLIALIGSEIVSAEMLDSRSEASTGSWFDRKQPD